MKKKPEWYHPKAQALKAEEGLSPRWGMTLSQKKQEIRVLRYGR